MSSEAMMKTPDDVESLVRQRVGELLRTFNPLREENERLAAEIARLEKLLTEAQSHGQANREARRAALNLMEDAVRARLAEQRENEVRRRVEGELRIADQRKDEFLAILAHELRNPLAPIRNSLEILRRADGDSGAADRVHDMLERQVNHMVRLVDDLLEVSRITRGQITLRMEPVALEAVVRAAVELSRPLIEAARHHLTIHLPEERVTLLADPTRVSQVLANLLTNAAKYTRDGGRIGLTARRDGADVAISVRDTGMGISREMLPRIFDLFTQVDRTLDRAHGGLGIGLTLVRSLVEAHGGRVEARSDGIDRGSEFVITLPLPQGEPLAPEPPPRDEPRPAGEPGRILVVDDNHDAADSMAMLLTLLGAETATVHGGQAALDLLPAFQPAGIFVDIGMPGMDGNEVARRIRSQPKFDGVTLIALTGWGQEEDRRRCREAGFDHHLVKPVDLAALEGLLASIPQGRAVPGV